MHILQLYNYITEMNTSIITSFKFYLLMIKSNLVIENLTYIDILIY